VEKKWWSEDEEVELLAKNKSEVLRAFGRAEKLPKPKLSEMFNDVWATKEGEEVPGVIVSSNWQKE
jgi:2-oxoisovalerate dehydrogenase E1 component alpha subunit